MTAAVVLAAAAGVCAAFALTELACARGGPVLVRGAARRHGEAEPLEPGAAERRGTEQPRGRALLGALTRVGRALGVPGAPGDLEGRLVAAGVGTRLGPPELMAAKTGAAIVALLVALPLATAAPGRLGLAVLVVLPCAAFLAPDAWLRRRTRARAQAMSVELADVLDLMRVAVGAGLPPTRAMAEVARRRPGVLTAELGAAAARIELGVPRSAALGDLEARCPLPAAEALVAALERSDRHGAPLGPALAALAAQARADRARAVREHAARAAPKIQLAIALGLVPGVLLLVAAALIAALT